MRQLFTELDERGISSPELHKVSVVLSSLDESYDRLVMTLEALPESQLTLAYLTGRLVEEEQKRADNRQERGQAAKESRAREAPTNKAAFQGNFDVPGVLIVKHCFACSSTSHLRRACPSLKD